MKKIGIILCFLIFTLSAYGQRFLWTTEEGTDLKHVPLESVTSEVLEFYDHYEYYYDGTGYSKDGFSEYFEEYGDGSDSWKSFANKIYEIEELRVVAFKGNLGRGSIVIVMIVDEDYVDVISFSDFPSRGALSAGSYDRDKFQKWFNTLLNIDMSEEVIHRSKSSDNYEDAKKQFGGLFGGGKGETNTPGNQGDPNGDPNSDVLSGISTGSGMIGGGLENRGGAGPPIEERSQEQGKVVIRICVDNTGKVVSAEYTQRGSTTQNRALISLAKNNAMKYRFNSGSVDKQCGTIAYNFRVL